MRERARSEPTPTRQRRRAEGVVSGPDTHRLDRLHDVFIRVQPKLWKTALAWSDSTEIADDAVEEAFISNASRRVGAMGPVPAALSSLGVVDSTDDRVPDDRVQ